MIATGVKLYNHKQGGSMICDEYRHTFGDFPTKEQIEDLVKHYRTIFFYKGAVFCELFLRIKGDEENGL